MPGRPRSRRIGALALILNLPLEDVDSLDVLDPVGKLQGLADAARRS